MKQDTDQTNDNSADEVEPLLMSIEPLKGHLLLPQAAIDKIEDLINMIAYPWMNTQAMHDKSRMYEEMVVRAGNHALKIKDVLQDAGILEPPSPKHSSSSLESIKVDMACRETLLINERIRRLIRAEGKLQTEQPS